MGKKKTPLLQKLRDNGGTLYVFPSASEDIGLNLQSTTTGVAMSHYALLNIPTLTIEKCIAGCAGPDLFPYVKNGNEALSLSLQNYMMNFETLLTNRESYNYQELSTVSEKVFWHWMEHIGAFDTSKLNKIPYGEEKIYMESGYNDDPKIQDDTVIKCFGAIDAGNQLSTEFGMYNETYINIPTSWGAGPVFLQSSSDSNYRTNYTYSPKNPMKLEGRDDNLLYYSYSGGLEYPLMDDNRKEYYKTNEIDGLTIVKDINKIQQLVREKFGNDEIVVGSYDDINIDVENYFGVDEEFGFNAILLYYSVYDQDDMIKTPYATNLFGIIFLDGTRPMSTVIEGKRLNDFYIPLSVKRKSTPKQFGNSYSFRVNLKSMSVYDNTDAIIQDNTTLSSTASVEFSDVISNLNRAIDVMNSNLQTTIAIQNQYASIVGSYDDLQVSVDDLSTCINAYLSGTKTSYIDTNILYVNEIRVKQKNDDNDLAVKTKSGEYDEAGDPLYNEPVIAIRDNEVAIPILKNNTQYNVTNYVVVPDKSQNDLHILDQANKSREIVYYNMRTLDKMFKSSKHLVVKLKNSNDADTNELYIDPTSVVFTSQDSTTSVKYLYDKENDAINYVGFIPFLIAEIQRLNSEVAKLKSADK